MGYNPNPMNPQIAGAEALPPVRSPLAGLLTVFFSPAATFRDAAQSGKRPWIVPMIACCLLALATNVMVVNVIGLETLTRTQLESKPQVAERLGPEAIDRISREAGESQARKWISYAAAFFFTPVILCLIAGLILGGLLMTGAETNFSSTLTATSLTWYVYMVIQAIAMAIFLLAVKDFTGVDFTNPIMLNPSIFLDQTTTSPALYSLASSLDLVTFFVIYLLSLGLSSVSRGVTFSKALTVVVVLWVVYVLGKVGFAALF